MGTANTPAIIPPGESAIALAARYPTFTAEDVATIHRTLMDPEATPEEMALFLHQCVRTGLDPMNKMIYAIHRWDNRLKRKKMTVQVGIDGFRSISEETGELDGIETYWCGDDGAWVDVWTDTVPPFAAKVIVYRKGCDHGFPHVALWSEYVQTDRNGNATPMWQNMGVNQIAKCAESGARRKAFPQKLGGLYTGDEMDQADNFDPEMRVEQAGPQPNANPKADAAVANAGKSPSGVAPRERPAPLPLPSPDDITFKEAVSNATAGRACSCGCKKPMKKGQMLAFFRMEDGRMFLAHQDCYSIALDEATNTEDADFVDVDGHEDRVRAAVAGTPAGDLLDGVGGEPDPMRDGKD